MMFKLALLVIMSILSQTDAAEIKASGDGKKRISHLRKKVQADASIAIKDDGISTDFSNQRALGRRRRGKASRKDRDPIEPSVPCGNGNCDPGENYLLCPKDCPAPTHDPIKPSDDDDEWEEDSDEPWCHGTFEVIARSNRNSVEVCAPSKSQVGDFLFLFIR